MSENIAGLLKILGITVILLVLWAFLSFKVPETFLSTNNIENLLRRTALYGILGIGVAFVIISSGIDLSIGSLVCLCACLLALFLEVEYAPMQMAKVWETNASEKTMLVSGVDLQKNDEVWYFHDRRDKGMLKVGSVESAENGRTKITIVEGSFRDHASSGSAVGTLSPTYAVSALNSDTQLTIDSSMPAVAARDMLKMVKLGGSTRERAVQESSKADGGTLISLADPVSGIDTSYRVVPVGRSAMMSIPLAVASVLGIALLLGLVHGLLITKWKQQPFIVTLCGLLIYRGISRWLTNDQTVGFIEYQESLGALATGRWVLWQSPEGTESFGIPYSFFVLVLLTVLAVIFLNFTVWGRYILALGRNEEAARYSGINTGPITILAYVICSGLAGIGGILFALDSNSIAPSSFGNFFELYAIAAAVLGGCSLRGGEGSILGVVVGTALMQTLYNSIVLLKIPDELEYTIIGAVILLGVVSDELVRRVAGSWRSKADKSASGQ